ncbi:hypothetical protein ACFPRL_30005 [Pseudoclavibacter helvolus]
MQSSSPSNSSRILRLSGRGGLGNPPARQKCYPAWQCVRVADN